MNPKDYIGRELSSFTFEVDHSQLRLFAKAIGETRPLYTELAAAKAAGYRDLPVPPTFPFTIGMNPQEPFDTFKVLNVNLAHVLHGEQSFEYLQPICSGDRVRVQREIVDAYQKKGGALTFFVLALRYEDAESGELYGNARQVFIVRGEELKHG